LGAILPPSYQEFLRVTNGWRTIGDEVGRLLSIDEVGWLRVRHPETIRDWLEGARSQGESLDVPDEKYFVYGRDQLADTVRLEYLSAALEISAEAFDGGVFLLNPEVRTPSGDWEAWFLAPWLAGAARYRSFWELMEDEYRQFTC
ncbi:MAG: SMI1/KNR4 family protein, partial [Chloroflexota bacterium]